MTLVITSLGAYVEAKRKELGIGQGDLADRAGLPRTTVNRLERGVTKLPEADVRRKLAKALGVTHVQLLVAAGELTDQELGEAGLSSERPAELTDEEIRLGGLIRRVGWNDERLEAVEGDLRFYIDFDARKGRR